MLRKELNENIISGLKDFFNANNYKLIKNGEMIYFRKKNADGFRHIALSSTNYYNKHYINFWYSKRVEKIEMIIKEIEKHFEENFFLTRIDSTTYHLNESKGLADKEYKQILGKTLQGELTIEVPKINETSKRLKEFQEIADKYKIKLVFEPE